MRGAGPVAYVTAAATQDPLQQEALFRRGMDLVRRLAFRMARRLPAHVDVDDLISAGMEGLIKAVGAYDPARQPSFDAYASARIRGAILDELRSHDSLTRHGRSRMGEISGAIAKLQRALGRAPTEDEVASALGMELDQYQKLSGDLARAPALAGLGSIAGDTVASAEQDPSELFDQAELRGLLAKAIASLPERSQQVLALYYQEECTQAEVGAILGITESRVCQILGETTARLRAKLGKFALAQDMQE